MEGCRGSKSMAICHQANITPRKKDGKVPINHFAKAVCPPRLDQPHPFGCPGYVLYNNLQQGKKSKKIGKWENGNHIGLYLVPSPTQDSDVFGHVKFDDFFETTKWQ